MEPVGTNSVLNPLKFTKRVELIVNVLIIKIIMIFLIMNDFYT